MRLPQPVSVLLVLATTTLGTNITDLGTIPGTTSHYLSAGGHQYHYVESSPANPSAGTILLLHGFPDFSYAWRYQIPFLTSLGYRVIAPDLLGYANTDSPCDITEFALRKMSTDMRDLLDQVAPNETIILGAHDWGAGLAYNFAMWYSEYLKAFFTLSVPYTRPWLGPERTWTELLNLVEDGTYPTLGYQLQWRELAINRNFTTKKEIRSFFNTVFGGLTTNGSAAVSPSEGLLYDVMPLLGNQTLVNSTDLQIYVDKISQKGLHSAFNWYRTRRMNWEDELPLAEQVGDSGFKFKTPHLFMPATEDTFMPPELYANYGQYFEEVEVQPIEAGHWSMWQKPEVVNGVLEKWLAGL